VIVSGGRALLWQLAQHKALAALLATLADQNPTAVACQITYVRPGQNSPHPNETYNSPKTLLLTHEALVLLLLQVLGNLPFNIFVAVLYSPC
jgi:hypothetical protein